MNTMICTIFYEDGKMDRYECVSVDVRNGFIDIERAGDFLTLIDQRGVSMVKLTFMEDDDD